MIKLLEKIGRGITDMYVALITCGLLGDMFPFEEKRKGLLFNMAEREVIRHNPDSFQSLRLEMLRSRKIIREEFIREVDNKLTAIKNLFNK